MNKLNRENIKSILNNEMVIGFGLGFAILFLFFVFSQGKVVTIADHQRNKSSEKQQDNNIYFEPSSVYYSNVLQKTEVNTTFKLVNKSTNELIISEIRTCCSWTVVSNEFAGKKIPANQSIIIPVSFYSGSRSGINDSSIEAFLESGTNRYLASAILRVNVIEEYVYNPRAINFGEVYPGQSVTQTVRFIPKALDDLVLTQSVNRIGPFEIFVKNPEKGSKKISEAMIVFHSPETTRSEYFSENIRISTSSKRMPIAEIPVCAKTVPENSVVPQMLVFPSTPITGESRLTITTRNPSKIVRLVSKTGNNTKEVQPFIEGENEFSTSHILLVTNKDIADAQQLDIQLRILRNQEKEENKSTFVVIKRIGSE